MQQHDARSEEGRTGGRGWDTPLVVDWQQVPIIAAPRASVVATIIDLAASPRVRGAAVHLCNAYVLALAAKDPAYRSLFAGGAVNLADGAPVAWAIRYGGAPDAAHLRGTDLVLEVADRGRDVGLRHYLLGGTAETVRDMATTLLERFPGLDLVGMESPPFRVLEEYELAAQAERITASGADVVWVGLGTPKQDYAVADIVARTGTVAVGVGAAFDFLAGAKPEASVWMQDSGLEWVHRLWCEPTRLWRRYLLGNSRFLYDLLRHPPRVVG